MAHIPLLQKALGDDWDKLPPVIQQHYTISPDSSTCLKGNMEIGYPSYLFSLISLIHLCGGLVSKRGKEIETIVKKTVSVENAALLWTRTLTYPDNKEDCFFSKMVYLQDHELIEYVRFGFGLRLKVSVEKGNLVYRSNGHVWQCGKVRLTFPDWLILGTATISESPVSDNSFKLNFYIRHPFLGTTYWYHGIFQYW